MKNNKSKLNRTGYYYMYGIHPVISALGNSKRKIINIYCNQNIFNNHKQILSQFQYEIVATKTLDKLLGNDYPHQGIIAKVQTIFSNNINDADLNNPNCKIAILDQITDPQNIGAIIRSAAAFDINAILLTHDNSPEESASLAKAAAGALEFIKIIKVTNIQNIIEFLKKEGFWIIGLDVKGNEHLSSDLFKNKLAIVLGAEDKGLRRLTQENCDFLIKIPINPNIESLNVASTASIVFYLTTK